MCAVPDPHIERWYLSDPVGLKSAFDSDHRPVVPQYQCERAIYKTELRRVLSGMGVNSPLGGVEFGDKISEWIDLPRAEESDGSLKQFSDDFSSAAAAFLNR